MRWKIDNLIYSFLSGVFKINISLEILDWFDSYHGGLCEKILKNTFALELVF